MPGIPDGRRKKNYIRDVLKHMGGFGYVIIAFLCNVSEGVFNTGLAILGGILLDAIYAHDRPGMNNIMAISAIISASLFISIYIKDYFFGAYLENGLANLKQKTIQPLNCARLSWLDKMHTGELSSRVTNDLDSLAAALRPVLIIGISWTFAQLISLCYLAYANLKLTSIIFALVPAVSLLQWRLGWRIKQFRMKNLEAVGNMASVASDCFGAFETVKSLALEKNMIKRFESSQEKQVAAAKNEIRIDAWLKPLSLLNEWMPKIAMLVAGGSIVIKGGMSIGQLMMFVALGNSAIKALSGLPDVYAAIRRLSASCVRIAQVWEVPKERDSGGISEPVQNNPVLELEHVRFEYGTGKPENTGLNNVSFRALGGEFIGLAGESGSGKSTILKLIASLYEPTEGVILFHGGDTRLWKLEDLRKRIAYVTQETFLFAGTIRENITCGKTGISEEKIMAAVEAAGLAGFIDSLPQGLETEIGERGVFLSGGQRQRISIARAILTHSDLLLLDEATSALDRKTEREVISLLLSLPHKPAVIFAAHRLSAIKNAACIHVVDRGRIVESGTHEQLKKAGGIYAGMLLSNLAEEEVGNHVF